MSASPPQPQLPWIRITAGLALSLAFSAWAIADRSHTVASGDTLGEIGQRYGVNAREIARINELDNPNRLRVGQVLTIPPDPSEPTAYTVRSGDTLGDIGQRYGVTAREIARINNLDNPNALRVGQNLLIPTSGQSPAPRYRLPDGLARSLDAISVSSRWRYVVVHHTATRSGSMKGLDDYHRQKRRMQNGLAYHFVIGNGNGIPNGKIEVGNRWTGQLNGGHLSSEDLNAISIGICLVGNFELDRPTQAQLESLYALISYLNQRCGISRSHVKTHREINRRPTQCPGRNFPTSSLRTKW